MRGLLMALAATSLATTALAAEPLQPSTITRPDWSRRPTTDQLQQVYPKRALRLEKSGAATVRCLVGPMGRMLDCKVLSETSEGLEFGKAALTATKFYTVRIPADGPSPVGQYVIFDVPFSVQPSP